MIEPQPAAARGADVTIDDMSQEALQRRLEELTSEHRDLDTAILSMMNAPSGDLLTAQRLKKRKLVLKDEIAKVRSLLLPDIIA